MGLKVMIKNKVNIYNYDNILNEKQDNDINDTAFCMWNSELNKELPNFWNSIYKN
jgi:hypothetical protein